MSTKLSMIAACFVFAATSACVAEVTGDPPSDDSARRFNDDVPLSALRSPDVPDDDRPETPEIPEDEPPQGCEATVETTGACSLACNVDALIEQFVPAGTCVLFTCELIDGNTLSIGGCKE